MTRRSWPGRACSHAVPPITKSRASPATLRASKVITFSVTGTAQRSARPPAPGALSRRGAPETSNSATTASAHSPPRRLARPGGGTRLRPRGLLPRRRATAPRPALREDCAGRPALDGGPVRRFPAPPGPARVGATELSALYVSALDVGALYVSALPLAPAAFGRCGRSTTGHVQQDPGGRRQCGAETSKTCRG